MQSHDEIKTENITFSSSSHQKTSISINEMISFYKSELETSRTGITCESPIVQYHVIKLKAINTGKLDHELRAAAWLFYHAGVYYNDKDYSKAAAYFKIITQVIQLDILDARYYGGALFYTGDYEGAIREFEKLKKINLGIADTLRLHRYLGDSYFKTKNYARAKHHLSLAITTSIEMEHARLTYLEDTVVDDFIRNLIDTQIGLHKLKRKDLCEAMEKLPSNELISALSTLDHSSESYEIALTVALRYKFHDITLYQNLSDYCGKHLNQTDLELFSDITFILLWRNYRKERSNSNQLITFLKKYRESLIISSPNRSIYFHLLLHTYFSKNDLLKNDISAYKSDVMNKIARLPKEAAVLIEEMTAIYSRKIFKITPLVEENKGETPVKNTKKISVPRQQIITVFKKNRPKTKKDNSKIVSPKKQNEIYNSVISKDKPVNTVTETIEQKIPQQSKTKPESNIKVEANSNDIDEHCKWLESILPKKVIEILNKLNSEHANYFLFGGATRDEQPADYDFIGGIKCQWMKDKNMFDEYKPELRQNAQGFKVLYFVASDDNHKKYKIQIQFANELRSLSADVRLSLRDISKRLVFTIDTLFYSTKKGLILGSDCALSDYKAKILRAVIEPKSLLESDPSRVFRVLDKACKYTLENSLSKALDDSSLLVKKFIAFDSKQDDAGKHTKKMMHLNSHISRMLSRHFGKAVDLLIQYNMMDILFPHELTTIKSKEWVKMVDTNRFSYNYALMAILVCAYPNIQSADAMKDVIDRNALLKANFDGYVERNNGDNACMQKLFETCKNNIYKATITTDNHSQYSTTSSTPIVLNSIFAPKSSVSTATVNTLTSGKNPTKT